jgi:hypothetical protein
VDRLSGLLVMMEWCVIKLKMEKGFKIWRAAADT